MNSTEKYAHIKGWGSDLDPANRPAYPMERTPPRLDPPVRWSVPEAQHQNIEVLKSIEHRSMTPVFGSGQPPRGVSGYVRRYAFGYSENDLRHWLLLLMADRLDVGEGLVEDLAHGHLPRIYSEMGGNAELRFNPWGAAKKALVLAVVAGGVYACLRNKKRK